MVPPEEQRDDQGGKAGGLKTFSLEEIAKHNNKVCYHSPGIFTRCVDVSPRMTRGSSSRTRSTM